jgi:nicotinamidase-related amidase
MKAVIFIDVQKDFIDGALRNEKAIEVTPKIVDFAKDCVENGYKLYATRDTHEKTKMNYHFEGDKRVDEIVGGYFATLEGEKLPVEHCIECSDGWMIDNRLMEVLDGKCTFVNKPTFGSFDLGEIIAEDFENNDLNEIVLCGFVTSICVVANAILLRAKFPNIKISVMKDLCAGITNDDHEAALKVLEMQQIEVV